MSRVICIDDKRTPFMRPDGISYAHLLKVGETYTVTGEVSFGYELLELPHPKGSYWYKRRFIPLSSTSETEMERNYQLNKQTV